MHSSSSKNIICRFYCTGQPTSIRRHLFLHALPLALGEVVDFKPGVVWNVHRQKGRWIKPEKTSHCRKFSQLKGFLNLFIDILFDLFGSYDCIHSIVMVILFVKFPFKILCFFQTDCRLGPGACLGCVKLWSAAFDRAIGRWPKLANCSQPGNCTDIPHIPLEKLWNVKH